MLLKQGPNTTPSKANSGKKQNKTKFDLKYDFLLFSEESRRV